MKTGSFSMPQLLNKSSFQLVSGGLSPINPYDHVPSNGPVHVNGYGGSDLHSSPSYNMTVTVDLNPHVFIYGSMQGYKNNPPYAGGIGIGMRGM